MIRCRLANGRRSSEAQGVVTKRGQKMQAEILAILQAADRAMSAYDVLHQLQASHPKIAPPTIYNALAALTKAGRVHRVESLKAYIACQFDGAHRSAVFSICDGCGTVQDRRAPQVVETLTGLVAESGFTARRHVIEVHGVCSSCASRT